MEKIKDYMTKQGWEKDWDQTKKNINSLAEKIFSSEFKLGEIVYFGEVSGNSQVCAFSIYPAKVLGYNHLNKRYQLKLTHDTSKKVVSGGREDILSRAEREELKFFGI